jgi:hypothetical protein
VLGGFEGPSEPGAWPSKDGQRIYIYLDILKLQESFKKVSRAMKSRPFSHKLLKKNVFQTV